MNNLDALKSRVLIIVFCGALLIAFCADYVYSWPPSPILVDEGSEKVLDDGGYQAFGQCVEGEVIHVGSVLCPPVVGWTRYCTADPMWSGEGCFSNVFGSRVAIECKYCKIAWESPHRAPQIPVYWLAADFPGRPLRSVVVLPTYYTFRRAATIRFRGVPACISEFRRSDGQVTRDLYFVKRNTSYEICMTVENSNEKSLAVANSVWAQYLAAVRIK